LLDYARSAWWGAQLTDVRSLSHKSDPRGEIPPRRDAKYLVPRLSQLNHDILVLSSSEPITSHQEAFLPESLRAFGTSFGGNKALKYTKNHLFHCYILTPL